MLNPSERERMLAVLDTCDTANDCGVDEDDVAWARDLVWAAPSQDRINQLRAWYLVTRMGQERAYIINALHNSSRLGFVIKANLEDPALSVEAAGLLYEGLVAEANARIKLLDDRINRVWDKCLENTWLGRK